MEWGRSINEVTEGSIRPERSKDPRSASNLFTIFFLLSWSTILELLATSSVSSTIDLALFWFAVIALVGSFYSGFFLGQKFMTLMVEALMMVGVFLSIYYFAPRVGLYQYDSLLNYASALSLEKYGWFLGHPTPSYLATVSPWSLLDFLLLETARIGGLPLLAAAKVLPVFLGLISSVMFFGFVSTLSDRRIATMLLPAFVAIDSWLWLNAGLVREAYATPEMWLFLWFYVKRIREAKLQWTVLLMLLLPVLVLSHSLIDFVTALFLGFHWMYSLLVKLHSRPAHAGGASFVPRLSLLAILAVGTVGFWAYLTLVPFTLLTGFVQEIIAGYHFERLSLGPRDWPVRLYYQYVGYAAFGLAFVVMILKRSGRNFPEQSFFPERMLAAWPLFIVAWAESLTFTQTLYFQVARYAAIAWQFLVVGIGAIAGRFSRARLTILVAIFVIFNLSLIPPYIYDQSFSANYAIAEVRQYFSETDYGMGTWVADHIPFQKSVACDEGDFHLVVFAGRESACATNVSAIEGAAKAASYYDFILVRDENFYGIFAVFAKANRTGVLSRASFESDLSSPSLSLVYSNGGAWVFASNDQNGP